MKILLLTGDESIKRKEIEIEGAQVALNEKCEFCSFPEFELKLPPFQLHKYVTQKIEECAENEQDLVIASWDSTVYMALRIAVKELGKSGKYPDCKIKCYNENDEYNYEVDHTGSVVPLNGKSDPNCIFNTLSDQIKDIYNLN